MSRQVIRYHFHEDVDLQYVEAELVLAAFNVESLHGPARARLEAAHFLDPEQRSLVIDATTQVGEDFNRLFVGGLMREVGADAFTIRRVDKQSSPIHQGSGGSSSP
jgi:hypothetical protein